MFIRKLYPILDITTYTIKTFGMFLTFFWLENPKKLEHQWQTQLQQRCHLICQSFKVTLIEKCVHLRILLLLRAELKLKKAETFNFRLKCRTTKNYGNSWQYENAAESLTTPNGVPNGRVPEIDAGPKSNVNKTIKVRRLSPTDDAMPSLPAMDTCSVAASRIFRKISWFLKLNIHGTYI